MPAIINGSSSATCNYTGAVSSITLEHIWVASGGLLYDPSYKVMQSTTRYQSGRGDGVRECRRLRGERASCRIPAGTAHQGFDATAQASYVQSVDEAALASALNGTATNLQHYVEANLPTARLEDVVGGRRH